MKTFNNNPELKAMLLAEIKWHQEQDMILKGTYGEKDEDGNWKGCAVGCSIHSLNRKLGKEFNTSEHSIYETQLGISKIIAWLEDGIFEGLPQERALKFPYEFMDAINVGVDVSPVWPKFLYWLLVDKKDGVIKFAKTDEQRKAIQGVADLYQRKINGETIDANEWLEKRKNAAAASDYVAATVAADYAAASDYAAYNYASYAAAAAAADPFKARERQADKLLELLREAK